MFAYWVAILLPSLGVVAVWLASLTILELTFPTSRTPWLSALKGLTFQVINLGVFAAIPILMFAIKAPSPLAVLHLKNLPLQPITEIIAALALGDFWFYWMHRIQHKWFWRFHSVHHAVENLSALNTYHHISEALFHTVFRSIPLGLIVYEVQQPTLLFWVVAAQGVYIHSSVRLHLGPLRYLVADNKFHRIHHSTDPAHFGKNFSAATPVWDIIFGTAHFPQKEDWPATGLADQREVSSTKEWLLRPFKARPPQQPGEAKLSRQPATR